MDWILATINVASINDTSQLMLITLSSLGDSDKLAYLHSLPEPCLLTYTQSMEDDNLALKDTSTCSFNCYLKETHFNAIANRADLEVRVYSVSVWNYDIADPTLVDLTSNVQT